MVAFMCSSSAALVLDLLNEPSSASRVRSCSSLQTSRTTYHSNLTNLLESRKTHVYLKTLIKKNARNVTAYYRLIKKETRRIVVLPNNPCLYG
jgi:hypothetical protein